MKTLSYWYLKIIITAIFALIAVSSQSQVSRTTVADVRGTPQLVQPSQNGVSNAAQLVASSNVIMVDAGGAAAAAQNASDPLGAAASVLAETVVNVKSYGSIANGKSHQACTSLGLSNLAQLQAYNSGEYSFATSCTNEMDWLATQKAVSALTGIGGTVSLPQGTMIWDQPLILPVGGSITTNGNTPSIRILGSSEGGTIIEPSVADFGPRSAMISCGLPTASYSDNSNAGSGRYTVAGECYESIEDISLFNPYYTGTATGSSTSYGPSNIVNVPEPVASGTPIQMDGFVIGGQTNLHHVSAWGFRMGLNVNGDHMTWDQADFQHNFCGVYFAAENKFNQGDIVMQGHFDVGANSLAGICVDKDAFLNVQESGELYIGRNPYGILKFAGYADTYLGGSGTSYYSFIVNSAFGGLVQSESVNNAAIWDDNLTQASGGVAVVANGGAIINTSMNLYASNYAVTPISTGGRGFNDWIGISVANGFTVHSWSNSMIYSSGMSAGIHVWSIGYQSGGLVLNADFDNLLPGYGTTPVVSVTNPSDSSIRYIRFINPGKWEGGCINMYTGQTPIVGSILENYDSASMQLSTGLKPAAGVAMQALTVPSSTAGGQCVAYANKGSAVNVSSSGMYSNSLMGTPAIAASGGIANSSATNGGYIIGTVVGFPSTTITTLELGPMGGFAPSVDLRNNLMHPQSVATVASATTIAPTTPQVVISGTAAIASSTIPTSFSTSLGGCFDSLATGTWTTTTAGNIYAAMTAVASTTYRWCYYPSTSKWYIK